MGVVVGRNKLNLYKYILFRAVLAYFDLVGLCGYMFND